MAQVLHGGRQGRSWLRTRVVVWALLAVGIAPGGALGQDAAAEKIRVDGAKIDFDRKTGWATARGNVVVRRGKQELRADFVRVNTDTEEAHAVGHVVLRIEGEQDWRGEELNYNFKTGVGGATGIAGGSEPFHVVAERTEKSAMDTYTMYNASVSTCSNRCDEWHYHIKAREITLVPNESISGRGATIYLGHVPVMYLPYWKRDLNDPFGWTLEPGYSSRMGAFLLTSYSYKINPVFEGETHLDLRTRRGVAIGQDLKWRDPNDHWSGDMATYYAHDSKPLDDDEDLATSDVNASRYRIRLNHQAALSPRDYLLMKAHYLSDTDILEDFFEDEYRAQRQPENYLTYTHRGNWYTLNAEARGRLNDFYSDVNRLPEASVDFTRSQIGNSDFYYEGQTAIGYLERVYAKDTDQEDYSSFRFDTEHTVYYPGKYFGFLNVVPRAGYRGTYYSDTFQTVSQTQTVTVVDTNGIASTSTKTNTVSQSRGADFRDTVEMGFELSFKAFKMWQGGVVSPLRHIVEPYLNYTLVPTPTLERENIYQFDSVDSLKEQHWTKIGCRNKIQTKVNDLPFDILDVDTYVVVNFDPDPGAGALERFYLDAELRPSNRTAIDFDGIFNFDKGEVERFNVQFWLSRLQHWEAFVEYRYRSNVSSLLSANVTFSPVTRWAFNVYGREEFEDGRLEEIGFKIRRNLDCMVIQAGVGFLPGYERTDGSQVNDEWRVLAEFWLTAFPHLSLSSG